MAVMVPLTWAVLSASLVTLLEQLLQEAQKPTPSDLATLKSMNAAGFPRQGLRLYGQKLISEIAGTGSEGCQYVIDNVTFCFTGLTQAQCNQLAGTVVASCPVNTAWNAPVPPL